MFSRLKTLVESQISLSRQEWQQFESAFTFRQVPRKFMLVREGDIARELYFVNKGVLRLFYNKEGEEVTGFLFSEGLFASSYESFLRRAPSIQSLETLEDADLLVLTSDALEKLYQDVPRINILTRKIAEQRFINAQLLLSSFIMETPEERYRKFAEQHPEILLRVPQHIIASYLGITPVSLSRIRARLSSK
ncbi:Crp/Fnr family transcriptional regulator [Flavihumibacter rivuli]|uniref:Crp/Fnr family transcriptional regulator n=1 Tax=Flavihumibacter rivuli TaxID=2838156 RepID=UPI002111577E|nr:Crp/Fnr family transcriptional regulator [Flavihumibacter rivuli]